ncbi:MAG TPA: MBL fold metallo-hydrolase [Gaiellaceae bacterium]|nr:MBL fold metallo-hydrolase [Gaiellaceae bacterium]
MIFRQFIDEDLGCASYLLADGGEAVVVDPSWDVAPYLEFAAAHRLVIGRVLETHTHADHVSGRGRIAAATGARIHLPAGAVAAFPSSELRDAEVVAVGDVRIEVVATPGHRPEHVSFVVTDYSRDDRPAFVLSGDSLLVGDVARPDLATQSELETDQAARALFDSLRRLALLPDDVELWPGHVGGSLCCSAGASEKPSSTIGLERRTNAGFAAGNAERFASELLAQLPERPPTVSRVVELNRGPLLLEPAPLTALGVDEVQRLVERGAAIVDGRDACAFDDASIPGSLCLPLGSSGVGTRAAWVLGHATPLVLVAEDEAQAHRLAAKLAAVGLIDVRGRLAGGIEAWKARGRPLVSTQRIDVHGAVDLLARDEAVLVDIRDASERAAGPVVGGSLHIPWRELPLRAHEAQENGRAIIVACASGARTPTAASLLTSLTGPPVLRIASGGVADVVVELRSATTERAA